MGEQEAFINSIRKYLAQTEPIRTRTLAGNASSISLCEAGTLWLRRARLEALEEGTIRQYEQHLRLHIVPILGDAPLPSLTTPMIERFKDHLLATRSRAMTRAVLTSLKGIFKESLRLGYCEHNVALSVQLRRQTRGHNPGNLSKNILIPSKEELRRLLRLSEEMFGINPGGVAPSRHTAGCWHPLIATAIFSGMRSSELRGLIWENVDCEKRIIRVRQRADFRNRMGPPKSAAGIRDIPMAPLVAYTLERWHTVCPSSALNLVFPSRSGQLHTNGNMHKQFWQPLQLAAGIVKFIPAADGQLIRKPKLNFHSLRHAAASLFIEQGWSPKKVQAIMGHSSIQVTFDRYGKLWGDPQGDVAAMASLEQQLLGVSLPA